MKSIRILPFLLSLILLSYSCHEPEPGIEENTNQSFQTIFRLISERDSADFSQLVKELDTDLSNARQENSSSIETDLGILLIDQTVVRVSDPNQYAPNYTTPLFSPESDPQASELLSFVSTANGYNGVILSFIPTDGSYDLKGFTGRIEVLNLERELELTTYLENGEVVDAPGGRMSSNDCELTVSFTYDPQWGWHYDIEMKCGGGGGAGSWPEDMGTPMGSSDPYNPDDGRAGGGGSSSEGEDGNSGVIGIDEIERPCPSGYTKDTDGNCVREETDLDKIMRCEELSNSQLNKLEGVLEEYLTNCFNAQVYQYIANKDLKYCFKIGGETPGGFQESTGTIFFRDINSINDNVFSEEFFHAYQSSFYNGLPTNLGRSNIEFEAKFFHDLTHEGFSCCMTFKRSEVFTEYVLWLAEITEDYTIMPSWQDIKDKYYYYLDEFKRDQPAYDYPTNYNLLPNAIFNIGNCN